VVEDVVGVFVLVVDELVVVVVVNVVLVVVVVVVEVGVVVVGHVLHTNGHFTPSSYCGSLHRSAIPAAKQSSGSGTLLHHLDLSTGKVVPSVVVSVLVVVKPSVVGVTVVVVGVPAAVVAVVVDVVFGQDLH